MCDLSVRTRKYLEYSENELEEKILNIGEDDDQKETVSLLVAYMIKKGLVFRKDISDDKDPRAILAGKTSVRYHHTTKIAANGNKIILYCYKDCKDCDAIVSEMGKTFFDNKRSDPTRPYGIVFEPSEFFKVVSILMKNGDNK